MKQLKIIANDYDITNGSGVISINFNQNIDILPYSSLSLDKISMEINPLPSGQFLLQSDQIILMNPANNTNTNANVTTPSTQRSILLKAGRYSYNTSSTVTPNTTGVPDIVATLNNLFNGALDGNPQVRPPFIKSECDFGLGFLWSGSVNSKGVYSVQLDVYQAELSEGNERKPMPLSLGVSNNLTAVANGYKANIEGTYNIVSKLPAIIGCFQQKIGLQLGDIDSVNYFKLGIGFTPATGNNPVVNYGLAFILDNVYIVNNGIETTEIPKSLFLPDILPGPGPIVLNKIIDIWMYTDSSTGHLRLAVYKQEVENAAKTLVYTTPINAYTGYDFNQSYITCITGSADGESPPNIYTSMIGITQPSVTIDNTGYFYDRQQPQTYLATPNLQFTPTRQVIIDYSKAPLVVYNLGFGVNVQVLSVSANIPSITQAPNGIDFRNWYDLGLDILNLPLESYVGFSNGKNCGKKNTIAYFLLQRISDSDALFFSESKQLTFLSIENKEKISLSSLQFRVYDVNSGQPINASSISFNLFVGDASDDGGHNRFDDKRFGIGHEVAQF